MFYRILVENQFLSQVKHASLFSCKVRLIGSILVAPSLLSAYPVLKKTNI